MENLKIYEAVRAVPDNAKKPISAGRLKGMTDINPMWRICALTGVFGPCGLGWWYDITDKRIVTDEITKQSAAFMDILLFYKDPETGEVSHGIPGTGGSSFVAQERNGPYMSDECFKMALTDAISVAAKALGVGADVYWGAGRSKYSDVADAQPKTKNPESSYEPGWEPAFETPPVPKPTCADCGAEISMKVHDYSVKAYKRPLCMACQKKGQA